MNRFSRRSFHMPRRRRSAVAALVVPAAAWVLAGALGASTVKPAEDGPLRSVLRAMALAESRLGEGEMEMAESAYRQGLYEGWRLVGSLAVAEGDDDAALEAFRRASTVAAGNRDALRSLGLVHLRLGSAPAAVAVFRDLVLRSPEDVAMRRLFSRALAADGQAAAAVQELEEARQRAPEDPELAFTLGMGHLRLGDRAQADALFTEAAGSPPDVGILVLVGRTYRDFGHHDAARGALRRALELDPEARRAHYYLGTVELLAEGRAGLAAAAESLRRELELVPDDPQANLFLGMALVEERRFGEALGPLEIASRGPDPSADAFHFLGQARFGLGDLEPARGALERALELASPTGPSPGPPDQLSSIHYQLGQALRRLGRPEEAARSFEAAKSASADLARDSRDRLSRYLESDLAGGDAADVTSTLQTPVASSLVPLSDDERKALRTEVSTSMARAYLNLGILATREQRFGAAADLLAVGSDLAPELPGLQKALGVALWSADRRGEAAAPLAKARRSAPDDAALRRMLALASLDAGDPGTAAELLEADVASPAAGAVEPSLGYAYALALVRGGRAAEAAPVFERLLTENAEWPELHVVLGQAHAQQGDFEAAKASLGRALDLRGDVAGAHATLGEIHLRRGELESAEAALRAELRSHPADRRARHHLATVLDLRGSSDEALDLLRALVEEDPGHADARYLLGKILLGSGEVREASLHLEAAVALTPDEPQAHYQLGQAYQKLGRVDDARARFDRFRALKAAERGAS
ncbi:MAG: tetratricopeptide repeat protein [Acidobacteriota bacterium]